MELKCLSDIGLSLLGGLHQTATYGSDSKPLKTAITSESGINRLPVLTIAVDVWVALDYIKR